jgi:ParB family chromosome partitioning protein
MGHARALAGVDDAILQLEYFKTILTKGLSVRKAEELVAGNSRTKQSSTSGPISTPQDSEIKKIVDQLSGKFGTKIKLERNPQGKGKIVIPFASDHELNAILDSLDED